MIEINNEQSLGEEEKFTSPRNSEWIIAVDYRRCVSILKAPNIHYGFFDGGYDAEMVGLPFEVDDSAGVYRWICEFEEYRNWESGSVDDWEFVPTKKELLWKAE